MTNDSRSYWHNTSPVVPLSTDIPKTVEVAVIGGGIIGASTCYWLAKEGISVALLEKTALAHGATGRNGGFVVAGPSVLYHQAIERFGYENAQSILNLTRQSQALLQEVLEEENIDCEYRVTDTMRFALTETQFEAYKKENEAFKKENFSASVLDRNQVQELIKTPISSDIIGGRLLSNQGVIHPAKLVQGLMHAAIRHGAQAYQAEVLKMEPDGDQVNVHTNRGTIQAKSVVVTVNAWVSKLIPELTNMIVPAREQMLAYKPIEPIFTMGLSASAVVDEYWQQRPDGTIVIGGCSSVAPNDDIGIWDSLPTQVVQNAIEQVLPRLFPSLPLLHVEQRWAGLLDCTTDYHPIVDKVPGIPSAFFVSGFSGHGMPFGMKFGQHLATTVKNGQVHPELKIFCLARPTLKN